MTLCQCGRDIDGDDWRRRYCDCCREFKCGEWRIKGYMESYKRKPKRRIGTVTLSGHIVKTDGKPNFNKEQRVIEREKKRLRLMR